MPTVIYSTEDTAGKGIAQVLKDSGPCRPLSGHDGFNVWECNGFKLAEVNTPLIQSNQIAHFPDVFGSDLLVFASRHSAESGTPSLTVHSTGNWGNAEHGGEDGTLCTTSGRASACALRWLGRNPLEGFDVTLEATHHGPTNVPWPAIFVEIGSTEREWVDDGAARRIADCIRFTCENYSKEEGKTYLGFGGTHYCSKFSKLVLEEGKCFSFIAAKYALDAVDAALIRQAVEKTREKVEAAVLDWKGANEFQRARLKQALDEVGLELVRA